MTKDTQQVEGLEEIVARLYPISTEAERYVITEQLRHNLSDPAILAHIPAYAALREENERRKLDYYDLVKANQRIADLESQLAALQGGLVVYGHLFQWQGEDDVLNDDEKEVIVNPENVLTLRDYRQYGGYKETVLYTKASTEQSGDAP